MTFKEAVLGLYSKNVWKAGVKLTCPQCSNRDFPKLNINTGNNAIKATCSECEAYIKFIPQSDVVLVSRG